MKHIHATLICLLTLALTSSPRAESKDNGLNAPSADTNAHSTGSCVVKISEEEAAQASAVDTAVSNILFINRCEGGCRLNAGNGDSRMDQSSLLINGGRLSQSIIGDDLYQEVVDCVQDIFAPYGIDVVTTDPGDVPHHESLLAGSAEELDFRTSLSTRSLGVAPSHPNCTPLDNQISFAFANSIVENFGDDAELLCQTVAHEAGHAYGLRHVFSCFDPMTYHTGCKQYFRNKDYQCADLNSEGHFEPIEACDCSGTTQNSHQMLSDIFGVSQLPDPPTIELLGPLEGDAVDGDFGVYVEAIDERIVDRVELWLSGTLYIGSSIDHLANDATRGSHIDDLYLFDVRDWPDGYINVEVKAFNDLDIGSSTSVRILKGNPCQSDDACWEGQRCVEGGCMYEQASIAIGASCWSDVNCAQGVCGESDGERMCTQSCQASDPESCGEGYECLQSSVCWPKEEQRGGCSTANSSGNLLPTLCALLFWFILGLRGRDEIVMDKNETKS